MAGADTAYNSADFGKKCTDAGCEDASVVPADDTTSVPSLSSPVTPEKCESNN